MNGREADERINRESRANKVNVNRRDENYREKLQILPKIDKYVSFSDSFTRTK